MKIDIECIMIGGPEHGRTLRVRQDAARPLRPAIVALDGELCLCAAWRHGRDGRRRCLLVHPRASGRQFREVLASCRRNLAGYCQSNPPSPRATGAVS